MCQQVDYFRKSKKYAYSVSFGIYFSSMSLRLF